MDSVTPRSWDVGCRTAALLLTVVVASGCGQARLAAPPTPQFTSGQEAVPTVVADDIGGGEGRDGNPILPSDVEPDLPAGDAVDPAEMVIVDDTGTAAPNRSLWDAFDRAIERRLGGNQAFGVAVMVDGRLVHEAAFGARVAGGEPVETTDRFRVASISKTITAIVAMQMVEAGELQLDEPVGELLAGHLALPTLDPDARSITVRELLSHTAGFPQAEAMFFSNGASSCHDAARQGLTGGVRSGVAYDYSNLSYCVLGVLIEAVSGQPYERVVTERLLEPLDLDDMRITGTYEVGPDEVGHPVTPNRNYMETLGAAGAWNASAADLVTIVNALDHATPGWKAVSADTARSMRFRADDGGPPTGYGLGIINYENDSWGHTGTIQNIHAMVLHQADGITWAITVAGGTPSNTGSLRTIMRTALAEAAATS